MKEGIRIGVLADTHMQKPDKALYDLREDLFSDVSMVLHAGDIGKPGILDVFFDKDVFAVAGNCDDDDIMEHYPVSQVITAGSAHIGLIHGWGTRESVMVRAREAFLDVEVIVFGHTHVPVCEKLDGVLMFNPGSYSRNRQGPWPRTVGILTVFPDGSLCGEIFPVPT